MPYLPIDDTRLYYEERGTGEPVVLIHGLGSSHRDWDLQLPDLAERYRVLLLDVRGHGRSGKPPGPYSVPRFAADVAALLRARDAAPAHVVGVSMGGMIAFQMALDAPEVVRSLVLVNTVPEVIVDTWRDRWELLLRTTMPRLLGMERMGHILAARLLPKPEHADFREAMARRWGENDRRAYLASIRALVGWSVADRLGEIHQPALVVAADQDYTPVAEKEAYVAALPNARLEVVEDARHALPVEHPEVFNRLVLDFWKEMCPATPAS